MGVMVLPIQDIAQWQADDGSMTDNMKVLLRDLLVTSFYVLRSFPRLLNPRK
jgi:hypothetical protein